MELQIFPTDFAKAMASKVGLYPDVDPYELEGEEREIAEEQHSRLREFQKLSVFSNYESSIHAYHGEEISEDQEVVLKLIATSTVPFAKGHIAEKLLSKLDGLDATKVSELLLDALNTGDINTSKAGALLIKVSPSK